MNDYGRIPKHKKDKFTAVFHEKTDHIISKKDREAYKKYNEQTTFMYRGKDMVRKADVGLHTCRYFRGLNFYFEAFLDFRTRIYRTGWPIGINSGVYKYFLISSQSVTVKLEKKNYKKELFSNKKN